MDAGPRRSSEIVGLGPFVLVGARRRPAAGVHAATRTTGGGTPHQTPLPYLDRLTVEIIPDQNAEALRLESGATDLMSNADIRPDDYARFKRLADQGRLKLLDAGWASIRTSSGSTSSRHRRKMPSRGCAAPSSDRRCRSASTVRRIANTVYLGAAVPVFGPITPRHGHVVFDRQSPRYPYDPGEGATAAGGCRPDGSRWRRQLEDAVGSPVRFSVLVQKDATLRERTVAFLQEQLRPLGICLDVVGLDPRRASANAGWSGDYDSIFHGFQASATDPAMNLDFWLSSGNSALLEPRPGQAGDRLGGADRRADAAAGAGAGSGRAAAAVRGGAAGVRRAVAGHLFRRSQSDHRHESAGRGTPTPVPQIPQLLWTADTLAVSGRAAPGNAVSSQTPKQPAVTPHLGSFILRRAAAAVVLVLVVSSAAVVLGRLAPGDHLSEFELTPRPDRRRTASPRARRSAPPCSISPGSPVRPTSIWASRPGIPAGASAT